jgi:hypothetical protein
MKTFFKILLLSLFLLLTSCGTMTYVTPVDNDRYYYRYYYYRVPSYNLYLDGMYNPYDYYYYYYRSYPSYNYAPSYGDHIRRETVTPAPTPAPSRRDPAVTPPPSRRETPPNSTSTPPPSNPNRTTTPPTRR